MTRFDPTGETWTMRDGTVIRVDAMEPSHRGAVIRMLLRHAWSIKDQAIWELLVGSMQMNGEAAQDSLEREAGELEDADSREFVMSLPIVREMIACGAEGYEHVMEGPA